MEGWRRFLRSDPDSGAAPPGNEGYFESWTKQTSARSLPSYGRTGEPSNYPLVYHYSDPQMQIGIILLLLLLKNSRVFQSVHVLRMCRILYLPCRPRTSAHADMEYVSVWTRPIDPFNVPARTRSKAFSNHSPIQLPPNVLFTIFYYLSPKDSSPYNSFSPTIPPYPFPLYTIPHSLTIYLSFLNSEKIVLHLYYYNTYCYQVTKFK